MVSAGGEGSSPAEFYDNYDQLEDGVGMWRMYHDSFWDESAVPTQQCGTTQH